MIPLGFKSLKSKEYNTDVQRWDPLSGGASSTLGMVTDFTTALGGTFIDPFRAYKLKRKDGSSGSAGGAAMMSAAGGVGSMVGVVTKGTLVDTPLALAEGLRNIPKLYGEEVKNHGQVKGVGSGSVVAAKVWFEVCILLNTPHRHLSFSPSHKSALYVLITYLNY